MNDPMLEDLRSQLVNIIQAASKHTDVVNKSVEYLKAGNEREKALAMALHTTLAEFNKHCFAMDEIVAVMTDILDSPKS
jgi:hypothetical protein